MTVELYKKSLKTLRDHDIPVDYGIPASSGLVDDLQAYFGHPLPPSYRAMLMDQGILAFEGTTIYGLGKTGLQADSAPSVVFTTRKSREVGEISDTMVRIMASGYGPYFVIDCSEVDDAGEAPVYKIAATGYLDGKELVAQNFGAFLLQEVELELQEA